MYTCPTQPSVGPLCHLGSDRPLAGLGGWAASSASEERLGLWATPFLKLPVSTRKAPEEEAGAPRADLRVHACVPQDQAREGAPRAPRAAGTGEHGFQGVHGGELGRGAGARGLSQRECTSGAAFLGDSSVMDGRERRCLGPC